MQVEFTYDEKKSEQVPELWFHLHHTWSNWQVISGR